MTIFPLVDELHKYALNDKARRPKSDGLVYLSGIAMLLQKRQILLILAKHHVLGVLLHVFVIRLTGISDGKHYSLTFDAVFVTHVSICIL